ncbi:ATP-binding cassette domain-containing protein [Conexibacter sp. W3-3-2]|uniref:ABC transporter ATP-binding protein n=1 Tax=Conexibacter sp. W3-3-2 TaxID=2675227 RepID=UPI0012B7EA9E|nr:ABC transporter ATP-binding protein [Conexibacter sp. W3-3-2]MTD44484.1 ATP-binding cassette domain-containing protein [Conexibacter sp. W3-3-2]
MSALLEVRDVTLRFGGVTALDGVSFTAARGELVAVIGPNGAGKTSVFNCISGVYVPQEGAVALDGVSLLGSRRRSADLGVGRTFQNLGLFPTLTVTENLLLGRHRHMRSGFLAGAAWLGRARREEREHRVHVGAILELLHLEAVQDAHVAMLPYGIQKRVELGRALAMEPRLLLLDEPVAGMNSEETEAMAAHVRAVRTARPELAVVLVEHDMPFVMGLADRVVALDFGRPIATGTPAEIQRDERVIAAYLGTAEVA